MRFSPVRLGIARKRRLLNKKGFAEALGVAQHTVVRWEKGDVEPTQENVFAFAKLLGFPSEFFYGADVVEPVQASFRSLTSMSAGERDASLASGAIGFMLSDWVESKFELPVVNVPDLRHFEPAVAARVLREEWNMGEKPISNMIHLLESKGVRVFSLSEETAKVNAFSIWRDSKPYVFLNNFKSAESSRFDAAHELGHLVLHQDCAFTGRLAEDQANKFASEFLMPRADVVAKISYISHLNQVMQAKERWRVSLAALCYRLHKVGIISDWKYRDFCIEMSCLGYNKKEPNPIERESSVVWEKVLKALWLEGITRSHIASQIFVPEDEINDILFGVVANPGETGKMQPSLRLVS